ncbi:UNVERIFIED_CONTAM: hypothetical protein FKN15_019825 [Acipenser sinensis]
MPASYRPLENKGQPGRCPPELTRRLASRVRCIVIRRNSPCQFYLPDPQEHQNKCDAPSNEKQQLHTARMQTCTPLTMTHPAHHAVMPVPEENLWDPINAIFEPRKATQRILQNQDHGQLSGNFQTAAEQPHLSPGEIKEKLQTGEQGTAQGSRVQHRGAGYSTGEQGTAQGSRVQHRGAGYSTGEQGTAQGSRTPRCGGFLSLLLSALSLLGRSHGCVRLDFGQPFSLKEMISSGRLPVRGLPLEDILLPTVMGSRVLCSVESGVLFPILLERSAVLSGVLFPILLERFAVLSGVLFPILLERSAVLSGVLFPIQLERSAVLSGVLFPILLESSAVLSGVLFPILLECSAVLSGVLFPILLECSAVLSGVLFPILLERSAVLSGVLFPILLECSAVLSGVLFPMLLERSAVLSGIPSLSPAVLNQSL